MLKEIYIQQKIIKYKLYYDENFDVDNIKDKCKFSIDDVYDIDNVDDKM